MTECQHCGRKSQLFLCSTCADELRETLKLLVERTATNMVTGEQRPTAGFTEALKDAALGHTRLGVSVRHSTDHTTPLPFNQNASQLLKTIHSKLADRVTDLCAKYGIGVWF